MSVLVGFLFSASLLLIGKWIKGKLSILTGVIPAGLFCYFISLIPQVVQSGGVVQDTLWVDSLGVNLRFFADGLSLIFVLMISGIGALVFFYTSSYLKGHQYLDRFYGYLGIFMSSMLGLVLSDNLITLFLFWELTSISSFFLIGFNNDKQDSRYSAFVALAITGIGGLFLLAGVVLLGDISQTYTISELINSRDVIHSSPLYIWVVIFFMIAAFTKSAQFPFHFWLPGAMKAPTPVSTYLHSATMVKAGVYLLLRFTPILGQTNLWNTTLIAVGAITMLYAAVHTIFRTDLKAILAYSTISALGILVFLTGIGSKQSLLAAVVFVLIHSTYKATLFLVTGIIDHSTGLRDITKLQGLGKVMMPVAAVAFFAAISHGGIPPTFGFVGKDLIYESTLAGSNAWVLTTLAVATNALLLYAGLVAGVRPFVGKLNQDLKVHKPSIVMILPPAILSALCLVFGIAPQIIENSLIRPAQSALGLEPDAQLALWHGPTPVLIYSAITLALGFALYFIIAPSKEKQQWASKYEKISPQGITETFSRGFDKFSRVVSLFFQGGKVTVYVKNTILVSTLLLSAVLINDLVYIVDLSSVAQITFHEVVALLVLILAILFATFNRQRIPAVVSLALLSFGMCMIYMMYGAPDLAMTQFSIDTLTTVLFVLMLYKLPDYLPQTCKREKIMDAALAGCFGLVITLICLEVLTVPQRTEISSFYGQNSFLQAHGKNVVNVIIVDFRGADTMMEISVLSLSAIGVYSLIKLMAKEKNKLES